MTEPPPAPSPPHRCTPPLRHPDAYRHQPAHPKPAPPHTQPEAAKPAAPGKRTGRPPAATMDQLIAIAQPAVTKHGTSTAVVKRALRDTGTPISSARFTQLMNHLKDEHALAPEPATEPEPARTT